MAATDVSVSLHYLTAPMLTQGTAMIHGHPVQTDIIATPTTSSQSTASPADTADHAYWRIVPFGDAVHVAFGSNPTATTSNMKVGAGVEFHIRANKGEKVAVIDA